MKFYQTKQSFTNSLLILFTVELKVQLLILFSFIFSNMSKLNPTTSLINPFQLLGVTTNSTISELKKAYYQLALLCHPDKGGNNDDMRVVHQSYKYIKKQMENANYTKS